MRHLLTVLLLFYSAAAFALGGCGTAGGPYYGFGSNATGGTNVVTVTNLNASGAGSFAAAVATSGACVKFAVSGTITLSGTSAVTAGTGVTIDGFSAPSPGITITCPGDCLQPSTVGNLIIQGIRVKNAGNDCLHIVQGHDIVIDHVSLNSCGDGNVDFTIAAHDATVSWSNISNNAASGASLTKYGSYHISFHHNLWYNNYPSNNTRVPWIEGDSDCCVSYVAPGLDLGTNADIEWNVIDRYTYGMLMASDGNTKVYGNIIGNLGLRDDGQGRFKNFITISGGAQNLSIPYIVGNASQVDLRTLQPSWGELVGAYSMINANTLNCPSTGAGIAAGACQATTAYTVPNPPPGPCLYDVTTASNTRVNEWTNVKNHAGVIDAFPDDSQDATTRSSVTIPTATALFTGAVGTSNSQSGSCTIGTNYNFAPTLSSTTSFAASTRLQANWSATIAGTTIALPSLQFSGTPIMTTTFQYHGQNQ